MFFSGFSECSKSLFADREQREKFNFDRVAENVHSVIKIFINFVHC